MREILSIFAAVLIVVPAMNLFAQPSFILDSTLTVLSAGGDGFMTAVDINNDGHPDIFATRGATLNRGDGRFNNIAPVNDLTVFRQMGVADVNGDGFVDFISPDFSTQTITFITNNSGFLVQGQTLSLAGLVPTAVFTTAVSAGDVNGDGFADLGVISRQPLGPLIVLTNNGSGNFAPLSIITNGIFAPVWIRLADVNGDHRTDIICGDLTSSVIVFTNAGGTNFVQSCVVSNMLGVAPSRLRIIGDVADVNGDGLPDLLCPSFSTNGSPFMNLLKVATNAGNGVFLSASTTVLAPLATTNTHGAIVIAADFNLDGKMDCVFQSEPDDRFVVATNRGDGTFVVATTMATVSNRLGLAVADFNGDGKPDIVSGDSSGFIQVYLNTTSPTSPQLQIVGAGAQSNAIFWRGVPGQFDLQFTTNVASTNWQTVANGVPITGLIVSNSAPSMFFRLKDR